jgi:hypothetical protein
MENVGIFYNYLEYLTAIWYTYFMAFWYNLCRFGIFFLIWYVWIKKNLATLLSRQFLKSAES